MNFTARLKRANLSYQKASDLTGISKTRLFNYFNGGPARLTEGELARVEAVLSTKWIRPLVSVDVGKTFGVVESDLAR